MLRIEIGKKLSVLPLKTLQPTKIHNKSKISLIDFLEKLRGIKPILAAILVSKMAAVGQKIFFLLFFNSAHQDLSSDTKYVQKTLFLDKKSLSPRIFP